MGTTFIKPTFFDAKGKVCGTNTQMYLPEYLDWMPIELKAFWMTARGYGDPEAKAVLLQSQGEQLLVILDKPLRHLTHKELQETDNGLESRCEEFARNSGISRTPRNQ